MLKEYFKKNALLYQYIYSALFPKYFCRVDDYGVKNKLAFEVAQSGYKNQRESLCFVQLQPPAVEVKQEQNEILDEAARVDVVEKVPLKLISAKKSKKRKVNTEKVLLKKKMRLKKG